MPLYTGTTANELIQGDAADDTLKGLAGNDTLIGGAGNDELWGGLGNDTYLFGRGGGHDVIAYDYDTSSNKLNVLEFESNVAPHQVRAERVGDQLVLTIIGTADKVTVESFFDSNLVTNAYNPVQEIRFSNGVTWDLNTIKNKAFVGTAGANTLLGTSAGDVFNGGKGNDEMGGKGGNDTYLFGKGDGKDVITYDYDTSSSKLNVLKFKAGVLPSEIVATRVGDNMVLSIVGTTDQITLNEFFNDDNPANAYNPIQRVSFVEGGAWNLQTLTNKAFAGHLASELTVGTIGSERIFGGAGSDTLKGLAGNDTLVGGAGNDELWGGAGNDTYVFGRGGGHDVIAYDYDTSTNKLNVLEFESNVAPGQVRAERLGDNLVISITGTSDQLTVSDFFDGNLVTNSYNPVQEVRFSNGVTWDVNTIKNKAFVGTAGANTLLGTSEGDIFNGGKGNDSLSGKGGNDTYVFGKGDGQDVIEYDYDTSSSKLNVLKFKLGVLPSDVIATQSGDDLELSISGTTDKVTLIDYFFQDNPANAYNPIQQVQFANGTTWNLQTITNKAFAGHVAAELTEGTLGGDTIFGGAGEDTLKGLAGDDRLVGGAGNDELWGGSGNDTYVFGRGGGHDVIVNDYDTSANKLNVLEFGANVVPSQILALRNGNALELAIAGTSDMVSINDFFYGNTVVNSYNPIQEFHFANGVNLTAADFSAVGTVQAAVSVAGEIAEVGLLGVAVDALAYV